MTDPPSRPSFPKMIGWVIPVFLVGWLAFLFLPMPRPEPPTTRIRARVPTKLEMLGLPEGLDFEGVPDFFAAFIDHAEWKDNRTLFAYWHPVMKTFSYHFEATRADGGYRFREIPEPDKDQYILDDNLPEDCPIRFYRSAPRPAESPTAASRAGAEKPPLVESPAPKVKIEPPRTEPLTPPPVAPEPKP